MTKHGSFSSFDHLSCFRHFGLRNFTIGIASKESILPRRSWAKTACWHPRAAGTAATTGQPEEEKPVELTIMELAPRPTPPSGPKSTPFIDTTKQTATKEEPEEKTFESNANSIGASELPALGIAPIPTQEGKQLPTKDLTNRQHSLEQEGAQPQPSSRPSSPPVPSATPRATPEPTAAQSPTATPPSTPQPTPKPTPSADLLAMFRASPPPAAHTPGAENEIRSPSPKASPPPVSHPPASSAYRRERIQERMAGNISKRGVSSVNAVGTPLGRYEKKVYDAIGKRWYAR